MKASSIPLGVKYLLGSFFALSADTRQASRHQLLSAISSLFGFRLYTRNLVWPSDKEFLEIWKKFPGKDGNRIHERRFNLYYLARSTRHIPGDTAECGVYRGAGSFIIMQASKSEGRTHHIFDSFQGLSHPDTRDTVTRKTAYQWKKGDLHVNPDLVKNNLSGYGSFELHQGWIPTRFPDVDDRRFSLVHIDVDLYQPTYDSLNFFYERMSPGGIIVCDDYGYETCPGAYRACNDFVMDKPEEIIHLTTGQGIIVKSCHPPC